MSLLLKALQNAAKNREAAEATRTETDTGSADRPSASGELALEPVQPTVRASTRAQPSTGEEASSQPAAPGPQQAQTIFRAGARTPRPARSQPGLLDWLARRPLVAFSTAAGLFAIGYGVYLYLQITSPGLFVARPSSPPPRASPQVATAPPAAAPASSMPRTMTAPPGSAAPPIAPPARELSAPSAPAAAASPDMTTSAPVAAPAAAEPARTVPSERIAPGRTPSSPGPTAHGEAVTAPVGSKAAASPARAGAAASDNIAVTRHAASDATPATSSRGASRPRPAARAAASPARAPSEGVAATGGAQIIAVDNTVLAAYHALEQGRLEEAERLYRQAIASSPRSIDALLGLAATLTQQNQGDAASQLYLRVLEQDPRNTYAQAGLLNLGGRADPAAAETRLKQLIAREPSAFLYFSLGNLYAGQDQWAAAQNAYFQAHNLAPDNPDYAFNLAVGLEHLSQLKLALDYYRRAVDLAKSRGHAQFDLARVENRIASLAATLAQNP